MCFGICLKLCFRQGRRKIWACSYLCRRDLILSARSKEVSSSGEQQNSMRYKVFATTTFVLMSCVGSAMAQERGIGVSLSKIEIGQNVEWPYTLPITVTNLSSETEVLEIHSKKMKERLFLSRPGDFL